jgi:hypothetical protein
MSLKHSCVAFLATRMWCYWKVAESLDSGASWKKGDIGTLSFPSLSTFWLPGNEQLLPLCDSCHDVLPTHRSKDNRAKQPRTKTSNTLSQNKSFLLLSWISQIFCHNEGKLTNSIRHPGWEDGRGLWHSPRFLQQLKSLRMWSLEGMGKEMETIILSQS